MNLTLGKTLTKSSTVKVEKPEEPVCLSMFVGLAKMCAQFTGLAPSANGGLIGCLKIQPKLFGGVPIDFEFPCFDLNKEEIRVIEPKIGDEKKDGIESSPKPDSDETIGGFRVEDILSVVSKTADQGIKIIGELLGLDEKTADEKPEAVTETVDTKSDSEAVVTEKTI